MVTIAGINKDLDKYLNSRRNKEERGFFIKNRPEPELQEQQAVPQDLKNDEVRVLEDKDPSFWERLFGKEKDVVSEDLTPEEMARLEAMESEIERVEQVEVEHPEMVAELEDVRESLLDRFFTMFRGFQRRHDLDRKAAHMQYIEEEVVPKIDEDVKRVLKIVHTWLGKLPKRHKDEFKKSKEFLEYKALLEKYGVAKVSAPKGEPKKAPKEEKGLPRIDAGKKGQSKSPAKKSGEPTIEFFE